MNIVINDRIQIISQNGQNLVVKQTWPGSGATGLANLNKEWTLHTTIYHYLNNHRDTTIKLPEPIIWSDENQEFYQQYIDSAVSVWSLFINNNPDKLKICTRIFEGLNNLHASKAFPSFQITSEAEMPPKPQLTELEYRSLPIWGRIFVGLYHNQLKGIYYSLNGCKYNKRTNIIHGDLSIDNILFSSTENQLYIIDWERSGIGAPEHDIAALYASILTANIWRFKEAKNNGVDFREVLTEWIDSWQGLIIETISLYRYPINQELLRVLLSAKIASRAYAAALAMGPHSTFTKTLMQVSEKINDTPSLFRSLYPNFIK